MALEPTANLASEDGPNVGVASRAATQLLPIKLTQLKLYPPQIEFYAIEPEILHVVRIVATNIDSVPHRIRLTHPKTKEFRLIDSPDVATAPGLEVYFEVEFFTTEPDKEFWDSVVVSTEDEQITVPIAATLPKSRIHFDGHVNMGVVVPGNSKFAYLKLGNEGERPGSFNFRWDDSLPIKLTPSQGILEEAGSPNDHVTIKMEFYGQQLGVFHAIANAELQHQESCALDISATVVEQTMLLMYKDGGLEIKELDFGGVFYGRPKSVQAVLFNNGPTQASFALAADEQDDPKKMNPFDKFFKIEPSQGLLEPFESRDVTLTFDPAEQEALKGWDSQTDNVGPSVGSAANSVKTVEVLETSQQIKLVMSGTGYKAQVHCDPTVISFGTCKVYEKKDVLMRIKNRNPELPMTFKVPKVANFRVDPQQCTLPPLGSRTLAVTYFPQQLGSCHNRLILTFDEGAAKVSVKVSGHAEPTTGVVDKKKVIAGIDKTDEDFKRDLNIVPHTSKNKKHSKFTRPNPAQKYMVEEDAEAFQSEFSLTLPQEMQKQAHRKQYDSYVVTQSNARKAKYAPKRPLVNHQEPKSELFEKVAQMEESERVYDSGLRSPRLELPKPDTDVWLAKGAGGGAAGGRKASTVFDQDKIFKRKFKPTPVSSNECRDCKQVLSADDLISIESGPKTIDFGTTCCYGPVVKSFAIFNPLQQSIVVAISTESEELKKSNPQSQVVPPGVTAGFDIILESDKVGPLRKTVGFTINEHHSNRFNVVANVVPKHLEPDRTELNFRFNDSNLEMFTQETVVLTNPWPHNAEFMVEAQSNDPFTPSMLSGTVPANGTCEFVVTFTPPLGDKAPRHTEEFILNVTGGPEIVVKCAADFTMPKVELVPAELDLGCLAVGARTEFSFHVKNTGKSTAVFHVVPSSHMIELNNTKGLIRPGGKFEVTASIKLPDCSTVNEHLTVMLRGGKPITLKLIAEGSLPKVAFEEAEYDFSDVTVGDYEMLLGNLKNTGRLPCTVYIDLSEHEGFAIKEFEELDKNMFKESPITIVESMDDDERPGTAMSLATDGEGQGPMASIYRIELPLRATLPLYFVFAPSETKSYAFELPLQFAGIEPGQNPIMDKYVMAGNGLKPRLSLSHKVADFGSRVTIKDRTKKPPYVMDITVRNEDSKEIEWHMDTSQLPNSNIVEPQWVIEPSSGTLGGCDETNMRILYYPKDSEVFEFTMPIYVDGNHEKRYLELTVKGSGRFPMILFSEPEVILPIVPLGIQAQAEFFVINSGHDQLVLEHKLPADLDRIPIQLAFPEGHQIGVGKDRIRVVVTFVSDKPVSFTARVDFMDADANRFSIRITGTADNSICTVYPYVIDNPIGEVTELKVQGAADSGPVVLVPLEKEPRAASRAVNEEDEDDEEEDENTNVLNLEGDGEEKKMKANQSKMQALPPHIQHGLSFMIRWLSHFVPTMAFQSIPDDFWKSKGKLLFDVIETLSGKTVQGRIQKLSSNKKEQIPQLIEQYESALTFLKQHGALLNHVKPENLLMPNEHMAFCKSGLNLNFDKDEGIPGNPTPVVKKKFSARKYVRTTVESWLDVLYQMTKVFMLGRVSMKQFRQMPGLPRKETEKMGTALTGSNVYSLPENLVLKWLTFHYNKTFPSNARRVTNLETDLEDGLVIAAVLISHAPYINKGGKVRQSLILNVQTPADRMQNLNKVMEIMNELALGSTLSLDDLMRPVARDLLLSCLFLYQTMPHYLPKTTIEFTGRLGEPIIKSIELTNSSNAPIRYSARLEGSSDFKLLQSEIQIEPKSKLACAIEFVGKFSSPKEAELFLIPERDGGAVGSALVFHLQSAIHEIKPTQHFQMESCMYEAKSQTIAIKNPYKADCVFSMITRQSLLDAKQMEEDVKSLPGSSLGSRANTAEKPPEEKKGKKKKKEKREPKKPVFLPDEKITEFFHVDVMEIPIKAGGVAEVNVTFVPFSPGIYRCELQLMDESSGEFTVHVHGVAAMPKLTDTIAVQCMRGKNMLKEYPLPWQNPAREAALVMLEKDFNFTPPTAPTESSLMFKVEHNHAAFKLSSQVALQPAGAEPLKNLKEGVSNGVLLLDFVPQEVMEYETEVIVHRPGDIRVFKLKGIGKSPGTEAQLMFSAPAREVTSQMIPIENGSDKPWSVTAEFDGDKSFSGPPSITVPPYQRAEYPLKFTPPWLCNVKSTLVLKNTTIDDKYTYHLAGTGEEPLAESHLAVECKVWDRHEMIFQVPPLVSGSAPQEITIQSDLPYISGPGTIQMQPGQPAECVLIVCPKLSGIYSGSVTFTAPAGEDEDIEPQYSWNTIEVNASSSDPIETLDISTELRQAIGIDIPISNPISQPIEFEVRIVGEGLLGERFVRLGPNESSVYELIYSPLRPEVGDGKITFTNSEAGEFWYKINLDAKKPPPLVLDQIECEIGKTASVSFTIENPTGESIRLKATNSNLTNFALQNTEELVMGPYAQLSLEMAYTASAVGVEQSSSLVLQHPRVADWEFVLCGIGLPPTTMPSTNFYAPLGQEISDPVTLRNPFERSIDVTVKLEVIDNTSSAFRLMGANPHGEKHMQLFEYQKVQIPLRFKPANLDNCFANVIVVENSTQVRWVFPVNGKVFVDTEVAQSLHYKCPARTALEETMEIQLPGLKASDGEVPITFEMQFAEGEEKMLSRALSIEPLAGGLEARHDAPLQFNLRFEPLRPMSTSVKLLIKRENGGQWTFDVEIEASEPEIDDVIEISALLNQTASVAFPLTNQFTTYTPFKAYFTPDSSLSFAVEPKTGLLEPFGTNGTQFVVSYTSVAYGKMDIGKLVILTEEMQWSYEVRGTLPQYEVPEGYVKVSNQLEPEVEGELDKIKRRPKKNYLKDQARRPRK